MELRSARPAHALDYEVKVNSTGKTYEVQLDKSFSVVSKGLDDHGEHGDGDGDKADGDGETAD